MLTFIAVCLAIGFALAFLQWLLVGVEALLILALKHRVWPQGAPEDHYTRQEQFRTWLEDHFTAALAQQQRRDIAAWKQYCPTFTRALEALRR